MRRYIYFLLIFLMIKSVSYFIGAQQLPRGPRNKRYYEFLGMAGTTDLLYVNDSIACLMSKSPLEAFPRYRNLYDSYKEITFVELKMEFGTEILPYDNTTYQVIWCLRDSVLYLSDIKFYSIYNHEYKLIFPNNEQYGLMTKLTKESFDTAKTPLSSNPYRHRNTIGMVPAKWSDDTILIKRARKSFEDIDKWFETPCEKLIFKNGKLISRETTDIY